MKDSNSLSDIKLSCKDLNDFDKKVRKIIEEEYSRLFSKVFEDSPLAMSINNIEDDKFIEVSNTFLQIMGYSREEVIGKTIKELDLFVDSDKLELISKKRLGKDKIKDEEIQVKSKDGNILTGIFSIEKIDRLGQESNLIIMVDITEKAKLMEEKEDKLDKLRNIIEGTNLGTWEWFIKTDIFEINERLARMLGYSLEELEPLYAKDFKERLHPDDLETSNRLLEKHLKGELENYDCEVRVKHKDGSWIWFQDRGKITERDRDGQALKMFGTYSDISERKRTEKVLKEREKMFYLALDGTEAGLWDVDILKGEMFLSPKWKSILGYEDYEIENSFKSWEDLWHPDERESVEKLRSDYLEGRTDHYEIVHRLKHKDGSWRWILTRGGILKDDEGIAYRWIGTNIDITEEKNQGLDLERFFSISSDLFCIVDVEGNFIKINKAWEKTLGYSTSELIGSKFISFIHEDDIQKTLKVFGRLDKDKTLTHFINRFKNKNGDYHYIEWTSSIFEDTTYASGRDITERIKYEEKILEISNKDPLTDVYNRRYIYERSKQLIDEHKRTGKIFSICIIDIDYFKSINDTYGHQAGDHILKKFTEIIGENLRSYDILGRYGGEEFIVVLNNADEKQSNSIIDRILNIVREKTFTFEDNTIDFTFSAGISTCTEIEKEELTIDKLFAIADKRMYRAKKEGRNKIIYK